MPPEFPVEEDTLPQECEDVNPASVDKTKGKKVCPIRLIHNLYKL